MRRVGLTRQLCGLALACAALLLSPDPLRADDIKPPIRGLVSMGAYRFASAGGDLVNTLGPLDAKPASLAAWS